MGDASNTKLDLCRDFVGLGVVRLDVISRAVLVYDARLRFAIPSFGYKIS